LGYGSLRLEERKGGELRMGARSTVDWKLGVPFKALPWQKFKTSETFDYMALSRSPDFTPPESDSLVSVVEEYMRQI